MKARLLLPLLLATLAACTPQDYDSPEMMVVEGWIESGAAPVIMVTTSIVPTAEKQSLSSLADHIEKWARVAVSDGTKEVVLTGKVSRNHIPSYIYTTGRMFGEPGKTYTITVDTDKYHCTASTVIPEPAELERLEPVPFGDGKDGWLLKAVWKDDPTQRNVYKLFSKIEKVDSVYAGCRLNYLDDIFLAGETAEAYISPSRNLYRSDEQWDCFFHGQTVSVKFCTVDPDCSGILKDLDESVTQAGVPLLVANRNIPGNVSGALGYFIVFGRTDYSITLP